MAKIEQRPTITLEASMVLNEAEVRALHALSEYGLRALLKAAENLLGPSQMKIHEAGLTSLFQSMRSLLPPIIKRTDEARWVFTGERVATRRPETFNP